MYRSEYNGKCFPPEDVIERAKTRCGEKEYNIFTNYARAFPRWCKTGCGGLTHDDALAADRYEQSRLSNI